MEPVIALQRVTKHYVRAGVPITVLDELDLEIAPSCFMALMGPSGSGKSTLLNLIAGIDRPTGGRISVNGVDLGAMDAAALTHWRARNIGFVFQSYNLMPGLDALSNVELPLLLTSLPAAKRRRSVAAALQLVGLAGRERHKPNELSGGQQQRVAVARAIVSDAPILVCDEPTGDLDRNAADEILSLLRELSRKHAKTIVMVTHDPKAAGYADITLHVDKGRLASVPESRSEAWSSSPSAALAK